MATAPESSFPVLSGDTTCDVCVIGGGIAGVIAAYQLDQAGFSVALVESHQTCGGVTGYTTAKVTSGHRLIYNQLFNDQSPRSAQAYADANQWGLEWIASTAESLAIDCDLERKDMLVFAENSEELEQVQKEFESAKNVGLPVTWAETAGLPFPTLGALRFADQIQFHARKFVLALASKLVASRGRIFENTRALEVNEDRTSSQVITDKGTVHAKFVVVASHYPIYDPAFFIARLAPYRDYAVAAKINGPLPAEMSIGAGESSKSFRTQASPDGDLLIVSGEAHKAGQEPNTKQRYANLENYTRSIFDVESIPYRWSAQDNETPDAMPYIGRITSGSEGCFVITGFNAWGMSTAGFAGRIVADLITGKANEWSEVFDPNRFKGMESLKSVVSENVNAVKHLIGDKFSDVEKKEIGSLEPGQAAILKVDGEKVAAFRDSAGVLHSISPICTHIGCDIGWNSAEETWDCPCHGSRFDIDGRVLHGPAVKDLERKV